MADPRLPQGTLDTVRQLAGEDRETQQALRVKAVEAHRRSRMLERLNETFERLRSDTATWADEQAERAAWDVTIADGLDAEPPHA